MNFFTYLIIDKAQKLTEALMGLKIIKQHEEKHKNAIVHFVYAEVSDVAQIAKDVHDDIVENSWINGLSAINKAAYERRAAETIKYIVDKILAKVKTKVGRNLGELVISTKAQDILESEHNHKKLPLAELWKEKIRGNPGFDFHTETPTNFIAFGEAKYNSRQPAYTAAIKQTVKFITKEKDIKELSDLQHFISEPTKANCLFPTSKAFSVAFSVHNGKPEKTFKQVTKCKKFAKLLKYPELYVIGIQFVS